MDLETKRRITKGEEHCVIDGAWNLKCLHCEQCFAITANGPMPIWYVTGVVWGFAYEHAECKDQNGTASDPE